MIDQVGYLEFVNLIVSIGGFSWFEISYFFSFPFFVLRSWLDVVLAGLKKFL